MFSDIFFTLFHDFLGGVTEKRLSLRPLTPPLLYLFVVCCLLIASIHFQTPKVPKTPKNPRPEVRWRGGAQGGKTKTVKLMTIDERVFHFQTYCILVQKEIEHRTLLPSFFHFSNPVRVGVELLYVPCLASPVALYETLQQCTAAFVLLLPRVGGGGASTTYFFRSPSRTRLDTALLQPARWMLLNEV